MSGSFAFPEICQDPSIYGTDAVACGMFAATSNAVQPGFNPAITNVPACLTSKIGCGMVGVVKEASIVYASGNPLYAGTLFWAAQTRTNASPVTGGQVMTAVRVAFGNQNARGAVLEFRSGSGAFGINVGTTTRFFQAASLNRGPSAATQPTVVNIDVSGMIALWPGTTLALLVNPPIPSTPPNPASGLIRIGITWNEIPINELRCSS